jgi:hypothetical protein
MSIRGGEDADDAGQPISSREHQDERGDEELKVRGDGSHRRSLGILAPHSARRKRPSRFGGGIIA